MAVALEYPVGAKVVPIEAVINDNGGGVTGLIVEIRIRRVIDNLYLDFNDWTFKNGGHIQIDKKLTDRGDGRYNYVWDSSKAINVPTSVVVEYTIDDPSVAGIDNDLITFTNSATILNNLAKTPLASVGDGPGSCRFVYTLTLANSSTPITSAIVYVTSDPAGSSIIAGPKVTDSNGKVTFYLDSGTTYYIWRSKGGVTFSNPDIETLS